MTLGILCVICGFLLAFGYNCLEDRRVNKVVFKNTLNATDMPVIMLKCGDKDINLLVDTGSDLSYISPSAVTFLKDSILSKKELQMNIVGGTSSSRNHTTEIELPITFDGKVFNESFVIIESLDTQFDKVREIKGIFIHGIIGITFLKKNKAVLDFNKFNIKLYEKGNNIKRKRNKP